MPSLSYTLQTKTGALWQTISSNVVISISGNNGVAPSDNPLGFGTSDNATMTAQIARTALPANYFLQPIRAFYNIGNAGNVFVFFGVMKDYSGDTDIVDLSCVSFAELIKGSRGYSPRVDQFRRRPVARRTTATSIDDPGSTSYDGGIMNWLLWQAGGRPFEQSGTYPSATFYYSLDQSLLAPKYSWTSGDNAWAQCQRLAESCGGQLYQDESGVIRYKQPLSFGSGTSLYTFNESVYGSIGIASRNDQRLAAVKVTHVKRDVQPTQFVIEDKTKRLIRPNTNIAFQLEPKWPCYSYSPDVNDFIVVFGDGTKAVANTDYNVGVDGTKAGIVTFQFNNLRTELIVVHSVKLKGRPVAAGESGVFSLGSGLPEKVISDNEFIQNESDAQRIANLIYTFYSAERPIYTLSGCIYDTNRFVGETVGLSNSALGLSNTRCLIVEKRHDDTGGNVDYSLCRIDDIPSRNGFFRVFDPADSAATTYAAGTVKQLSY